MLLSALGYLTTPSTTAFSEPKKPEPSPYNPPKDLPWGDTSRNYLLYTQGDVKISREIVWNREYGYDTPTLDAHFIDIETGNGADDIHVRNGDGGSLEILVNGRCYQIEKQVSGPRLHLRITTKGGDDTVRIDDNVKHNVDVDSGEGDDQVQAGGGQTRLFGGCGNDTLRLGSGLGYAEGNDGDDTLIGGSGSNVLYGNNGSDYLYAGGGANTKQAYLDGGNGNDQLYAGNGHSVLHGGNDDDQLVGNDRTTFYTGKGNNRIYRNTKGDLIYAKDSDHFDRKRGSIFTPVKPSDAGEKGFAIEGTEEERQRVKDDFEFLRSSPIGQQALTEMDRLAELNGGKVTVKPTRYQDDEYKYGSTQLDEMTPEQLRDTDDSVVGVITNGAAGSRADRATIIFNPSDIAQNGDGTKTLVPSTSLFHEMAHAYNGATGTMLDGQGEEISPTGEKYIINNLEYQAIGVPNNDAPFDLDNDPSTPPSNINPAPFTENALNAEMGKPLRKFHAYSLD